MGRLDSGVPATELDDLSHRLTAKNTSQWRASCPDIELESFVNSPGVFVALLDDDPLPLCPWVTLVLQQDSSLSIWMLRTSPQFQNVGAWAVQGGRVAVPLFWKGDAITARCITRPSRLGQRGFPVDSFADDGNPARTRRTEWFDTT